MFVTRSAKRTVLPTSTRAGRTVNVTRHAADDAPIAGDLVRAGARRREREDGGDRAEQTLHGTYLRGTRGPIEHTTS